MIVVEAGHVYDLEGVDGAAPQRIRFVLRRDAAARLLSGDRRRGGILTQELLRVAIDRTLYLNAEDPCAEDVEIVHKLRDCLRLYESRASRRTIEKKPMPERERVCTECGHMLCDHRQGGPTQ